jgi:two-component system aerobic respiration control protein ArcA
LGDKKKINVKHLVEEIEKITKKKMLQRDVISLGDYRKLKKKDQTPFHILLIDDDDSFRTAMTRFLKGEGYKVTASLDGTQLSDVLGDDPLDLILLDVGLPWVNGFELAEILKESDDLSEIPLIFISGKADDLDIMRGKKLGAVDFLKKPFELKELKKKLEDLL